jgi:hypothetical protein
MSRLFLALLLVPLTLAAQTEPRDEKIETLAHDLRTLSRTAEVAKELRDSKQVMLTIVDQNIESMRVKRGDDTYQWASLQRVEEDRVSVEKGVDKVQSEKELNTITVTAPNAYRVEIAAPRKRSLVSANNRVYVRNLIVDSTSFDGRTTHVEIPVNVWVNPGDSHGVALADIGKSVRATAELGVESGSKQGVANVSLLQAKLVDDPASPYFPAVTRLLRVRQLAAASDIQRGALKTAVDEALLAIPGELEKRAAEQALAAQERKYMLSTGTMKGSIEPGDATPDVARELSEVNRLLSGTLDEQSEGRRRLKSLADALAPRAAAK